jgi:hypothetical protein
MIMQIITPSLQIHQIPFLTHDGNQNHHIRDHTGHMALLFYKVSYSRYDNLRDVSDNEL